MPQSVTQQLQDMFPLPTHFLLHCWSEMMHGHSSYGVMMIVRSHNICACEIIMKCLNLPIWNFSCMYMWLQAYTQHMECSPTCILTQAYMHFNYAWMFTVRVYSWAWFTVVVDICGFLTRECHMLYQWRNQIYWYSITVADPGGWIGWLATPPPSPLVCSLHNIFVWVLSDLLEQTILVNQLFDEMQINHSDRESTYL